MKRLALNLILNNHLIQDMELAVRQPLSLIMYPDPKLRVATPINIYPEFRLTLNRDLGFSVKLARQLQMNLRAYDDNRCNSPR